MNKRGLSILIGFLVLLSFFNFVQAKDLVSESGVVYSDRILEQFNNLEGTGETFVDVIIYPKNIQDKEEIISDLSDKNTGRILNRNISNKITVELTEETFFELLEDEKIEKISFNAPIKLTLEESAPLINADDAWSSGYTGEGIKVCIIDSGIDTDHPNLPTPIDEKCYNSDNECPDSTSEDDSAEDEIGHGTHVVGIIASQNLFNHGIAHDAEIL